MNYEFDTLKIRTDVLEKDNNILKPILFLAVHRAIQSLAEIPLERRHKIYGLGFADTMI